MALATATNASVSLAPEVTSRGAAPAIAALTVADLPAALAAAGLRGRCIHGVWCISVTDIPEDREHPAQRRRLAIVPLAHLVPENSADPAAAAGARLATALRACVVPSAWNRPGWSLTWMATWPGLPAANGLLIAADPPTMHAVLDACDVLDRLGVEAGLEALAR